MKGAVGCSSETWCPEIGSDNMKYVNGIRGGDIFPSTSLRSEYDKRPGENV